MTVMSGVHLSYCSFHQRHLQNERLCRPLGGQWESIPFPCWSSVLCAGVAVTTYSR